MATKKELIAEIKSECGNVMTIKQVGEFLGLCPKATRAFLDGVPWFAIGRKRCYFAVDLANRLIEAEV